MTWQGAQGFWQETIRGFWKTGSNNNCRSILTAFVFHIDVNLIGIEFCFVACYFNRHLGTLNDVHENIGTMSLNKYLKMAERIRVLMALSISIQINLG